MPRRFVLALSAAALALPVARADDPLVQRVYPVADLVVPPATERARPGRPTPAGVLNYQKLVRTVTSRVAPASWSHQGGAGTIDYMPIGISLVVNQTPAVHEEVVNLLEALRRPEREIAFAVRLIAVSDECCAALGQPGAPASGTSLLTGCELQALLEKVQIDRRTNVMQLPRVTAPDGKEATVRTEDQHFYVTGVERREIDGIAAFVPTKEALSSGVALTVRGSVLPGGTDVAVMVRAVFTHVQGGAPLFPVSTLMTTVSDDGRKGQSVPFLEHIQQPTQMTCGVTKVLGIPAGRTAAFGAGRRTREIVDVAKVPVLGDLPLLGEFFTARTSRTEAENLIVLVTPTILEGGGEEAEAVAVPPQVQLDMLTFSVGDGFWANTHGPAARLATDNFVLLGDDGPAFRDALRECGGCTIIAEPRLVTPAGRPASFGWKRVVAAFTPTPSADGAFVKVAGTVWGLDAAAGSPVLPTVTMPGGASAVYKLGRDCATGETLYMLLTPRTK